MAIPKQSRLDKEGINYRENEIPGKNRYSDEINPYDENNEDVLSHDDRPWGKGTGKAMTYAKRDLTAPKTKIDYTSIITSEEAGGMYDKYGTKGVEKAFQGDSGREWAKTINEYSSMNQYGKDSVNIDTSVRGQYVTES